jgi:hypothetical protein
MIIFAGIAILFIQRAGTDEPIDRMYKYLPPCIGCAAANYAGNHGYGSLSWILIISVLIYCLIVLKPFKQSV